MKYHAQHGAACLPVTALRSIHYDRTTLVLSSEGASLCVRNSENPKVILRLRVFRSQNIHGISNHFLEQDGNLAKYHLIVWGGRLLCVCTLVVEWKHPRSDTAIELLAAKPMRVSDWIMTVVMHHERPESTLLTAHNSLWKVEVNFDHSSSLTWLAHGLTTLLYCGSLCMPDNDRVLVAAGTVFGEVVYWTCFRSSTAKSGWSTSTRNLFLGHRGSVFGIALSDSIVHRNRSYRLLASCSDDRTIRIWDVSEYHQESSDQQEQILGDGHTGFGLTRSERAQLTMTWGHLSRIWGVSFHTADTNSDTSIGLISRGEDGTCQLWDLEFAQLFAGAATATGKVLCLTSADRHHSGKNVWSLDIVYEPQLSVYTGGADGQIILRKLSEQSEQNRTSLKFHEIFDSLPGCTAVAMKQYLLFEGGIVFAVTDTGELVRMKIFGNQDKGVVSRSLKEDVSTLCSNNSGGLLFYGLADGSVGIFDNTKGVDLGTITRLSSRAVWMRIVHHANQSTTKRLVHLVVNLHGGSVPKLITILCDENTLTTQELDIDLPRDFVITSATFHMASNTLFCGSRLGAVAIISPVKSDNGEVAQYTIFRHVHGSDTVTSVLPLSSEPDWDYSASVPILSTGRDGFFAIHRVRITSISIEFETLHKATTQLGSNIEGAYVRLSNASDKVLLLYGFKSKEFVVWDETSQIQLLSIDCGGAHRAWNYSPQTQDLEQFVWTKAGTFNFHVKNLPDHEIIQRGGHGREIKSLAITRSSYLCDQASHNSDRTILIASGAEDTDIRLFEHTETALKQVGILRNHTTGIQALKFSECGCYLFSSGGMEEFMVWKLIKAPLTGIGAVMVGILERSGQDDDARIMSFDIIEQTPQTPQSRTFLILMAYSNGKAKTLEFNHGSNSSPGSFTPVLQLNVGMLCLTQAIIQTEDKSLGMLIGATDGVVRYSSMGTIKGSISSCQVHQSNIATMSVQKISSHTYAIVTGGDDNALAFTILHIQGGCVHFGTMSMPSVHSAAVTAVAIVSASSALQDNSMLFISAGNDQSIHLWRVNGLEHIQESCRMLRGETESSDLEKILNMLTIERVSDIVTDVADVSSLEITRLKEVPKKCLVIEALVAGVGMQTIQFRVRT